MCVYMLYLILCLPMKLIAFTVTIPSNPKTQLQAKWEWHHSNYSSARGFYEADVLRVAIYHS